RNPIPPAGWGSPHRACREPSNPRESAPGRPYYLPTATRGKESSRGRRVTPGQTRDHRPCDRAHRDPHARRREVTMNTTWSRREFLELSGAAVGASLAPTSLRAGRVWPGVTRLPRL